MAALGALHGMKGAENNPNAFGEIPQAANMFEQAVGVAGSKKEPTSASPYGPTSEVTQPTPTDDPEDLRTQLTTESNSPRSKI